MKSKITIELIKEVHRAAILSGSRDESLLLDIVRDEGTLHYISERSNGISDDTERAAFALFSISNYHPFTEGNKRTAVLVAELALGPGLFIDADAEELNAAVRKIGSEYGTLELAVKWMKEHVKRID